MILPFQTIPLEQTNLLDDFTPYPPIDGIETYPDNRIKPKKNKLLYIGIGVAVLTVLYFIFKK